MKKTFSSTKLYKVCFKFAVSILLVCVLALVPTIFLTQEKPLPEEYFSNKSEYQGVAELWNIDCFEGGTSSKTSFLSASAIDFEKQNKGFYVMVKNMNIDECLLAISQGQLPAMFSFSGQLAKNFDNLLAPISNDYKINSNVLESSTKAGKNYAVGWCHGGYALISSLQKVPMLEFDNLANLTLASGTTITSRKGQQKVTYSLVFGAKTTNPLVAYEQKCGQIVQSPTAFDKTCYQKTAYQAYCDFVESKANILLGSQRDVARIENRISQGKISDVFYEFLGTQTDLVQYVGLTEILSEEQKAMCQKFIDYLVSKKAQQKLANIGMFSVIDGLELYSGGVLCQFEKSFEKGYIVPKIFEN